MQSQARAKAQTLLVDVVEPLELHYKHYESTNNELLKQANAIWVGMS